MAGEGAQGENHFAFPRRAVPGEWHRQSGGEAGLSPEPSDTGTWALLVEARQGQREGGSQRPGLATALLLLRAVRGRQWYRGWLRRGGLDTSSLQTEEDRELGGDGRRL